MSAKTVFISYRRDSTGKLFARLLAEGLTRNGYDVFLDVDSLDAGKWEAQILMQVPLRSHFLLLLTPGSLDRCASEDDWVRREFELAVKSGRNIVPVREESVDLAKLENDRPESMKSVFDFQIAAVNHDSFKRDVEDLVTRYIPPHKAPQPLTNESANDCVVSPTRLHHGADHLFGREEELAALDQVWNDPTKKVLTIVAFGGVGKTSLVIEWMARQAAKNWQGFERVFDWSFFSQGVREKGGATADTFVAAALKFFGDEGMADSAASPWDKGARLARLVAERRALLVLDGVEPLQHPPGPLAGELKDPALATLLKGLARSNAGLCIVTTREHMADLSPFRDTTSPEWHLHHLSKPSGVELLRNLGVRGTEVEFQKLVDDVKGHALTLNLLGRYLVKAHNGDIRKSDQVKFDKADEKIQGGYAFKTIGAYEKWLSDGGAEGARSLAILKLLGLFDRPADSGCLEALRREPAIDGLTEPLIGLHEVDWNLTLSSLVDCGLIFLQTDEREIRSSHVALDAHPLLREYFAKQLREKNLDGWRSAHRRLYEHLCTTNVGDQPTLEELQPLYQAVAHGCQAGMHLAAYENVYFARIKKQNEYYSVRRLGAFGADLGALACFFDRPWQRINAAIPETKHAVVLSQAATYLRSLGRLTEALDPSRAGLMNAVSQNDWKNAAISASNLSELELTLGELVEAVKSAELSVTYADNSGEEFLKVGMRTTHADALHQALRLIEAEKLFHKAEEMHGKWQPYYPLLYSLQGFRYSDFLLSVPERIAWQSHMRLSVSGTPSLLLDTCRSVYERTAKTLQWMQEYSASSLLDIALNQLTLGRVSFYQAIFDGATLDPCYSFLQLALDGIRRAGTQDNLPRGLLARAWLRSVAREHTGSESAQTDLDEAWEIAERGPMRLHMADIHLYRARLFHAVNPYPWKSPLEDLAAARKLIEQCGYWRRKEELEDAEEAAKNW